MAAMAPAALEYDPVLQSTHLVLALFPLVARYLPATQFKHVDSAVAPVVVEYLPFSHNIQDSGPITILNVPGSQAVHTKPSGPVYPALHVQFVSTVLEMFRVDESAGQSSQELDKAAG